VQKSELHKKWPRKATLCARPKAVGARLLHKKCVENRTLCARPVGVEKHIFYSVQLEYVRRDGINTGASSRRAISGRPYARPNKARQAFTC
jgi:hypothetical protein